MIVMERLAVSGDQTSDRAPHLRSHQLPISTSTANRQPLTASHGRPTSRSSQEPLAEAAAGVVAVSARLQEDACACSRRAAGRVGGDAGAADRVQERDRSGHGRAGSIDDRSVLRRLSRGRGRLRRVRRVALLSRDLARRARRRGSARGYLSPRHPHGPDVLRSDAHRGSSVATHDRHDARAVDRRRESVDHVALDASSSSALSRCWSRRARRLRE